jgi:hypothetical protein
MAHPRRMKSPAKSILGEGHLLDSEELFCSTVKGKLKEQHKKILT